MISSISQRSQEEGQLQEINILGDGTNFSSVDGDSVSEHAWSWDLDGIVPIGVVVAESVGEVEDGLLGQIGRILSNVEVSGLSGSLGDIVGDNEEIEAAILDLGLFDEA